METQQMAAADFPPVTAPKFIRRNDLTREIRIALAIQAYTAQINGQWGVITALSKAYQVSRTFIYSELSIFKEKMGGLFSPRGEGTANFQGNV